PCVDSPRILRSRAQGAGSLMDLASAPRYANRCSRQALWSRCMRRASLYTSCLVLVGVLAATSRVHADPAPSIDWLGEPLPAGSRARLGTPRLRHAAMVIGVAYAPDGKTFASSGWDSVIRIWDAATGREIRRFVASTLPIYSVAYTPDGKYLGSAGQEKIIR